MEAPVVLLGALLLACFVALIAALYVAMGSRRQIAELAQRLSELNRRLVDAPPPAALPSAPLPSTTPTPAAPTAEAPAPQSPADAPPPALASKTPAADEPASRTPLPPPPDFSVSAAARVTRTMRGIDPWRTDAGSVMKERA